ncbi:MAG: biotin transporter BioY [Halomonadaceae bacterium]|nr:biotin transporter BioY [Halomonadaceae bacterium]
MSNRRIPLLAFCAALVFGATLSHADSFSLHFRIQGLTANTDQVTNPPQDGGGSEEGGETTPDDGVDWTLSGGELPKAFFGKPYTHSLKSYLSESDLEDVAWSGTELPDWLELDSGSGLLTGTPLAGEEGDNEFNVSATRYQKTDSAVYTLAVGDAVLDVVEISGGSASTCAVTTDGAAKCWGRNQYGQLGDGTKTDRRLPVTVRRLESGVRSISVGAYHACAVTTSDQAYCWGHNQSRQVGASTIDDRTSPMLVASNITTISAGLHNTCATTTSGQVLCWGSGIAKSPDASLPHHRSDIVNGISNAVSVSVGSDSACALTGSGAVYCWGRNGKGQIGQTANNNFPVKSAQLVTGMSSGVASISVGERYACAVTTAGAAKCWGENYMAKLGDGTTIQRDTPRQVWGLSSGVADISAGMGSATATCAVMLDGSAKCWGYANGGRLGDGVRSNEAVSRPKDVLTGDDHYVQIHSALTHTCAVTEAGDAKCWGNNSSGKLGNGAGSGYVYAPEPVLAGE